MLRMFCAGAESSVSAVLLFDCGMNEPGGPLGLPGSFALLGAAGRQRPLLRYLEMFLQGKVKNGSGEASAGGEK